MTVHEITSYLEQIAPLSLQESFDNSGLIIGSGKKETDKALITIDITEDVVKEAIEYDCDLIISHHPIIYKALKKIDHQSAIGSIITKLIKADIAAYAIHTNLDNILDGVNGILAQKLGLRDLKVLSPKKDTLNKLVVFCPTDHVNSVQQAIFNAGAGNIGNYSSCSFNSEGYGTFMATEGAKPFVGDIGKIRKEEEVKIESIVPSYFVKQVVTAMITAHPYEEVAYDIFPLDNNQFNVGSGIIGELKQETEINEFLIWVKEQLDTPKIRHSKLLEKKVKKIAICGGSGSFLIHDAYSAGADVFITGDVKYHDFFEYNGEMTIVDAGHFETEQFTKELIYSRLIRKFPNFALQISKARTNPIYFL